MTSAARIHVVESNDRDDFEKEVNEYLACGWRISSSSCGFVNSAEYNFVSTFQAILVIDNGN